MNNYKLQIKQICENAIARLEQQKNIDIQNVRQKILQEKITAYNNDLDKKASLAIQQRSNEMNEKVKALQAEFNKEKDAIIEACNKEKARNEETAIASEIATLVFAYDKAITAYRKEMEELGE